MSFSVIRHADLEEPILTSICLLKDKNWKHGLTKQRQWLKDNLAEDDIHILNFNANNELKGYLNIVLRVAVSGTETIGVFGIGNVCVDPSQKGKGVGSGLMQYANAYVDERDQIAILLCRNALQHFYAKSGWMVLEKTMITTNFSLDGVHVMCYPANAHVGLEQKGLSLNGGPF